MLKFDEPRKFMWGGKEGGGVVAREADEGLIVTSGEKADQLYT